MINTILDTVFNSLLMGASGYVLFTLKPSEHPFAFAASAMGFCHSCTGIYAIFFNTSGGPDDSAGKCFSRIKIFTTSCMEIVPVPLTNMDLYSGSQQTNALALGHGLFIIPLAFDLTYTFFRADRQAEDAPTTVLKDLTILGNIVSLLFYAANENNLPAGVMVVATFIAYYGSLIMESVLPGTGKNTTLAGYALFLGSITPAIRASSGGFVTAVAS